MRNKKMSNKILKITLPFLLTVLFSLYVNAFAVSMPHLEDKTLTLYPGASTDFELILQNMVGGDDEIAVVTIEEGSDIARIVDKTNSYKIPRGTKDTKAHIKIDIPSYTPLGTMWTVRFKAISVTEKEGGMIQLSGGVSDYIKVRVGTVPEQLPEQLVLPKEKSANSLFFILGGIILALIIVVSLVSYNRKKGKKE